MTASADAPRQTLRPMRSFEPILVARYEKDSWVAYYQHKWFTLLRLFRLLDSRHATQARGNDDSRDLRKVSQVPTHRLS